MSKVEPVPARRSRESDRSGKIIAAASKLFGQRGFHSVSLQDIGDEVGLDASSLYFHFPNKEAIFVAVVSWLIDSAEEMYEEVFTAPGTPAEHLTAMIEQTMRSQIGQRHYFLATPADLQLVPRELRRQLVEKRRRGAHRRTETLMELHPGMTRNEAEVMVDALACISVGLTHHRADLPKPQLIDLLIRMGMAAAFLPPVAGKTRPTEVKLERGPGDESNRRQPNQGYQRQPSSSRERILTDALRLFRQGGFDGIGVEAIAGASGITGPGVYRHFESKQEILETIFDRAIGLLASTVHRAFDAAADAREALDRLIGSYIDLALEDSDLLAVFWTQRESLPREKRLLVARELRGLAKDWSGVLVDVRPDLDEAAARTMVYEALWIVNSYWYYDGQSAMSQARPILQSMATNALLAPELS